MRELHHNQYVQLVMLPMFLFSATFYPLSIYPTVIRDVVAALPLYQATNLIRGLTLGHVGRSQVFAVVYLCVFGLLSLWFGARRLTRLLGH
jgi:lipooligosaccharide transport system permease protein